MKFFAKFAEKSQDFAHSGVENRIGLYYTKQVEFLYSLNFFPAGKRRRGYLMRNEKLRNVAIIAHVDHGKTAPQG